MSESIGELAAMMIPPSGVVQRERGYSPSLVPSVIAHSHPGQGFNTCGGAGDITPGSFEGIVPPAEIAPPCGHGITCAADVPPGTARAATNPRRIPKITARFTPNLRGAMAVCIESHHINPA
jgi:hypothetical protein